MRGKGLSTGEALVGLGEVMKYPGDIHNFSDFHHRTHQADVNQFELAKAIVEKLGFKGFTFNRNELSVTYSTNWTRDLDTILQEALDKAFLRSLNKEPKRKRK
jgi:hypothetical protein